MGARQGHLHLIGSEAPGDSFRGPCSTVPTPAKAHWPSARRVGYGLYLRTCLSRCGRPDSALRRPNPQNSNDSAQARIWPAPGA